MSETSERQPKPVDVAIIGAGFAGLGMAIKLRQAGREDFVLLEQADEVGGTWRDNRYPGCACDVQSHVYSYSFELNPDWTRMFAAQPEIFAYLRHCADKYGLRPFIRFGCALLEARYDEGLARWLLHGADGSRYSARILVLGLGPLNRPALPTLPGIECFRGESFHSATWPADFQAKGRRIAVIGTGASAIQFVPQIAPTAAALHLFQRTPPWIMPKPDRPIGAAQRRRYRRFPWLQRLRRRAIYWELESRVLGFAHPALMRQVERITRHHLHKAVKDPSLRQRLTPGYRLGCKRVLISNDYYPALTLPQVEVIDGAPIEIREHAVVGPDGVERTVDTIIFGTGFQAQKPLPIGLVIGRDGRDLGQQWSERMEAYRGTTVTGFPNMFVLIGPNTGLGHNSMIDIIESQLHYVMHCLEALDRHDLAALEVSAKAQDDYNAALQQRLHGTVWAGAGGCRSWYQNADGKVTALWPGLAYGFRRATRELRLEDYQLSPRSNDGAKR